MVFSQNRKNSEKLKTSADFLGFWVWFFFLSLEFFRLEFFLQMSKKEPALQLNNF